MSKLLFFAIAWLALVTADSWAQVANPVLSSIPVHEFAQQDIAQGILQGLAERYHIVIGVYGVIIGGDRIRPIHVEVKDGTLEQVFDAITKADPRFRWHPNSNGSVHFVTSSSPLSLMDIKVRSFDDKDPQREEIVDHLFNLPDLQGWLRDHKCVRSHDTIVISGQRPMPWGKFSVHAAELPLSLILDEVAAKSQTYYWNAIQYSTEPCGIDIQWGNAQSQKRDRRE